MVIQILLSCQNFARSFILFKNYQDNFGVESLLFLFGFFLTLFFYFPGIMTPDSDFQLLMARDWSFTDWHPVIMSIVWRPLDAIVAGPALMLILFAGLYWISFALFARAARHVRPSLAVLFTVIAFLPFTINLLGTIWKDIFTAGSFMLTLALLATNFTFNQATYNKKDIKYNVTALFLLTLIIIVLLTLAILLRHNSLLAAVPILILLICCLPAGSRLLDDEKTTVSLLPYVGVFVVLTVCIVLYSGLANSIVNGVANPTKTHPLSSLLIFDILGISNALGQNFVPGNWTALQAEKWVNVCYTDKWWDQVWIACSDLLEKTRQDGIWANLSNTWADVVLSNPIEYLKHRLSHTLYFFRPSHQYMINPIPSEISLSYGFRPHIASYIEAYIQFVQNLPGAWTLFTMGFWIAASTVALLFFGIRLFWFKKPSLVSFTIVFSGWLYCSPLILISVSLDLRYVYYTILATCIGIAWKFVEDAQFKSSKLSVII